MYLCSRNKNIIQTNFSPPESRIIGYTMLHIEWIMSEKEDLKALKEALREEIKSKLRNGFAFNENHNTLILDLGQIYSFRDMQAALKIFEECRVKKGINGFIIEVDFRN